MGGEDMKTLFLIRHSEPQKNIELPTELIPLSERGEYLAEELFSQAEFQDVCRVYASPYKRAYDTAEYLGKEVTADPRLRERELGNKATLNADFWSHQYEDHAFKNEGGESLNEVRERMTACINEILLDLRDGEKAVVVAHAAAICAYLLNFCTIRVLDAEHKLREITHNGKTVLTGSIDTPSCFTLFFDGDRLCDISSKRRSWEMDKIERMVEVFCRENSIAVNLSHDMPVGYETAYGTYDVTINTLFLNTGILQEAPEYEVLFYLFHELRHAVQYLRPELFDSQIQESRFYVVLYNGVCFKLEGNVWQEVALEGAEDYFTSAYLSLPYELDANAFAYERAKTICVNSNQLQELYRFWMPKEKIDYGELKMLFFRIDQSLSR